MVRVTPLLRPDLHHSEKPVVFQWLTRSSAIYTTLLLAHHTHTYLPDVVLPGTSHALCSGTLASVLNLKRAHHSSASRSWLKLSSRYILTGIGRQINT